MFKFFILIAFSSSAYASQPYPYNSFKYDRHWPEAPRYPETCCQLMWQDIKLNEDLPKDYVRAGDFEGRQWAFGRGKYNEDYIIPTVKSDQPNERPMTIAHRDVTESNFPILVNPNNCHISWYKNRFFGELIPRRDEWVFPSLGHSRYCSFAKYQNVPGRCYQHDGTFMKMKSARLESNYEEIRVPGIELLYVDCKKSILSMSSASLFNITYDADAFERLKNQPQKVIYHKKMMVNNSPMPSKANVEFQIETIDNASMILTNSFSDIFKTGSKTYKEFVKKWNVGGKAGFSFFGIKFGASAGRESGNRDVKEEVSMSDKSRAGSQEIFRSQSKRKLFKFGQEIQIPSYSKVTVTAFSKPVTGEIPFSAIYELTPTNYLTIDQLEKTIAKYNPGEDMKRVGDKLHMVYNGYIDIDSGHEVDVDIQTVPLPGHSFDSYIHTTQTYKLLPNTK